LWWGSEAEGGCESEVAVIEVGEEAVMMVLVE
jgi:hypothetical protein